MINLNQRSMGQTPSVENGMKWEDQWPDECNMTKPKMDHVLEMIKWNGAKQGMSKLWTKHEDMIKWKSQGWMKADESCAAMDFD